jgi:hypothetical protein
MNLNRISRKLKLKPRSLANGVRNFPPVERQEKDEISCEIDAVLSEILDAEHKNMYANVQQISDRISEIRHRLENAPANLRHIESVVTERLYKLSSCGCKRLRQLGENYMNALNALESFRKNNGLNRPAHLMKNPIWNWSALMLIFSMGVTLNGLLLQGIQWQDLIVMSSAVFMIGFINISIGLGIGASYRYRNHYQWYKSLLGSLAALTLVAVLLFFSCLSGYWHDALVDIDTGVGFLSAYSQLDFRSPDNYSGSPFLLSHYGSYLLAIAGCVFGCIAAWRAYTWKDPYPGYTQISMGEYDWSQKYKQALNQQHSALESVQAEANTDILAVCNSYDKDRQLIFDCSQEIKGVKEDYQDYIAVIQRHGEYLYMNYRYINMKKRTTLPPQCFAIKYMVPEQFLNTEEAEKQVMNAEWKSKTDVHALAQGIEKDIATLYKEFHEIHQMFHAVDNMSQELFTAANARIEEMWNRIKPTTSSTGQLSND